MTRIYSTPNGPVAHLVRHALEGEGIAAEVRGETRAAFVGEIPPLETWIEVWVSEADVAAAAPVVRTFTTETEEAPDSWACDCGETVEGQFAACWRCGSAAPEPATA